MRARAEEFRRKAQECFDLARKISFERDRAVLLDIAQNWLRLAEQQENAQEETPPPAVEQPQAAAQQQQQTQPKDDDKKVGRLSWRPRPSSVEFTKVENADPAPAAVSVRDRVLHCGQSRSRA
jgi:hypothetical protein